MIVAVTLIEKAIREVHVSIGEEHTIQRTALHVNGASVLETMVIHGAEVERHVFESCPIGDRCNAPCWSMIEYYACCDSFNGYVLRQIGQRVFASLEHFDGLTRLGIRNSRSYSFIRNIANLGSRNLFTFVDGCLNPLCLSGKSFIYGN